MKAFRGIQKLNGKGVCTGIHNTISSIALDGRIIKPQAHLIEELEMLVVILSEV